MANVIIPYRFWVRRDTAANWTSVNPTPDDGEWCLETDTRLLKMGDGATPWNSLDYYSGSAFTALSDVPASYTGAGGYAVLVKATEDGLEFGALTAASVGVADAGGYFTGTDVESVLQEVGASLGGGGGSGTVFRRNYYTVGAQANPSQVGVLIISNATTIANNTPSSTSVYTMLPRIIYRATASASAVAGFYNSNAASIWRGDAAGRGGFDYKVTWGAAEGLTNTSCRGFVGLTNAAGTSSDANPSTLINMIGMGWDSADTNIQIMHNDGSGTATKVDLGASFPVPTVDSTEVYSLTLRSDPNGSSVDYEVLRMSTQATASGTISTDLPSSTTFMMPRGYISAGGVSTQTSIALMYLGWEPGQ